MAKWRSLLQIFENEHSVGYGQLLTDTQVQVVDVIAKRRHSRIQLILPTQYGKSLSVALGVLLRVATHKEKWAIIAPTEDKARIIMDYIIDHIFDDQLFLEQLEYYGSKEKLKQERSKLRITFRDGGEVRVYTGNAANSQATKKALMGFGAANIILDESALIPDDLYATVKRMLGGSQDNFLLEIGNPFYRNHFYRTWFGDRYVKIYRDYQDALAEGRYTEDYIAEMREEAFFDVLYECLFPAESEVLPSGYRRLISDVNVDGAYAEDLPELQGATTEAGQLVWLVYENGQIADFDKPVLGIDVSGTGRNLTKLVVRFPQLGIAFVAATLTTEDLEQIADAAEDVIQTWGITDYRTAIDAGGVGHGLPAIMRRRGYLVKAVMFGEKAPNKTFVNMRAWMYWGVRSALRGGELQLVRDLGFEELKTVYYKRTNTDKTQIEPKEDMIRREAKEGRQVDSPDTADALALTFADTGTIVEEDDVEVLEPVGQAVLEEDDIVVD